MRTKTYTVKLTEKQQAMLKGYSKEIRETVHQGIKACISKVKNKAFYANIEFIENLKNNKEREESEKLKPKPRISGTIMTDGGRLCEPLT